MELNIKLSLEQANKVIEALSTMPFKDVHEIIAIIHEQGEKQLKANKANKDNKNGYKRNS